MFISKLDAARRQLETAVNLYFHEGDQVSIHTLACNAHEIVKNINRGKGGSPTIKESWKDNIKPEYVKTFYKKIDAARNFFKHSGKNENESIELAEFYSNMILLDACWTYRRVTNERLPLFATFESWSAITWGKGFIVYPGLDQAVPGVAEWSKLSRQEFFSMMIPVAYLAMVTVPPRPEPVAPPKMK
jgi:hypothetical protein